MPAAGRQRDCSVDYFIYLKHTHSGRSINQVFYLRESIFHFEGKRVAKKFHLKRCMIPAGNFPLFLKII